MSSKVAQVRYLSTTTLRSPSSSADQSQYLQLEFLTFGKTQNQCQLTTRTQNIELVPIHKPQPGSDMATGAVSWSLFDDHCFCEANGVCMRQLFADETCYEVPIGHHECITPSSPHYQEGDHQISVLSISSNSDSSTMINESPRPTHPSSGLMISHSIAMKEARTALEKLIAVEVQMEEHHLRILDTVEIDGAGFVPSLAVGDHVYYERALRAAIAGHGRLRGAYWRVVQMEERLGLGQNRKLRLTKKDLDEAYQDLRRWLETQTNGTTGEHQGSSDMKPQHSPEDRKRDAGLLSGDDKPPEEEITATICNYMQPGPDIQLESLPKDDMANDEAKTDECASSGTREWPLGKLILKLGRLLRHLCGLPNPRKLVDS